MKISITNPYCDSIVCGEKLLSSFNRHQSWYLGHQLWYSKIRRILERIWIVLQESGVAGTDKILWCWWRRTKGFSFLIIIIFSSWNSIIVYWERKTLLSCIRMKGIFTSSNSLWTPVNNSFDFFSRSNLLLIFKNIKNTYWYFQ